MFGLSRKKEKQDKDDGIIVIKKTPPGVCGGTDATLDTKAPKKIESEDMILFDVTTALDWIVGDGPDENPLMFISAFAVPAGKGSFLFLETADYAGYGEKSSSWALLTENVFPDLVKFVNGREIAKKNGYRSRTHGLPENFGGEVDIRYSGGERIGFSDNQAPLLEQETAEELKDIFERAMKGERMPIPDVSSLKSIRYREDRGDGGFTDAVLTLSEDGTGTNRKTSKYEGPGIYESEKPVDPETVRRIKEIITGSGMLGWGSLPGGGYRTGGDKSLTFVLADGTQIKTESGKMLPERFGRRFFEIELEMTVKHRSRVRFSSSVTQ